MGSFCQSQTKHRVKPNIGMKTLMEFSLTLAVSIAYAFFDFPNLGVFSRQHGGRQN